MVRLRSALYEVPLSSVAQRDFAYDGFSLIVIQKCTCSQPPRQPPRAGWLQLYFDPAPHINPGRLLRTPDEKFPLDISFNITYDTGIIAGIIAGIATDTSLVDVLSVFISQEVVIR